jgi:hypothetical protein
MALTATSLASRSSSSTTTTTVTATAVNGLAITMPVKQKVGGGKLGGTGGVIESPFPALSNITIGLGGEHAALFVREARGFVSEARQAAADVLASASGMAPPPSAEAGIAGPALIGVGLLGLLAWAIFR